MEEVSFGGLLIVALIAFGAPLLLGFFPRLPVPAVVAEILLGILVGPSVFGWVEVDGPIRVLSVLGLATLMFLAGLEIDLSALRGRPLRMAGLSYLASLGIALVIGYLLGATGQVVSPLFIAIVLASTSLGIVIAVLKDADQESTPLGQLTIAGSSIADFGAVILLSLFFSGESTSFGSQAVLLVVFVALVGVVGLGLSGAAGTRRIGGVVTALADTTAQLRVRGAVLLLVTFVALAERLGLETILGAFMAGALLRQVDRSAESHPQFHTKLEAIGFGFLIPIFFVTSGLNFDLQALFADAATVLRVPIFLVALLLVRGVPSLLFRGLVGARGATAAGLLQATSLSFIVPAVAIGQELELITTATGAALIAAGLASVVIFPTLASPLLARGEDAPLPAGERAGSANL